MQQPSIEQRALGASSASRWDRARTSQQRHRCGPNRAGASVRRDATRRAVESTNALIVEIAEV
jgi:hypothetical protein